MSRNMFFLHAFVFGFSTVINAFMRRARKLETCSILSRNYTNTSGNKVMKAEFLYPGHQDFKTAKNIRCLNVHPDKCEHQAAQQAFQKVMVAWSTLENAQSRQDYVGKLMQAAQRQAQAHRAIAGVRRPLSCAPPSAGAGSAAVVETAEKAAKAIAVEHGSLHFCQKHVRAQVYSGNSRNFSFRSEAEKATSEKRAKFFLEAVAKQVLAFDGCANAAARKALLEPLGLKPQSTKALTRDALVQALCAKQVVSFETALEQQFLETQQAAAAAKEQHMPSAAVAGVDIHHRFFCSPVLQPPKLAYAPVYLHPGCFAALRGAGFQRCLHGLLLGHKRQSQWRVSNIIVASSKSDVTEVATKAVEQHMDDGLVCIGCLVCNGRAEPGPTAEEAEAARTSKLRQEGSPCLFLGISYSTRPYGHFQVWDCADQPPKQVLVHFQARKQAGDDFQFLDLDRQGSDVRSLTLDALTKRLAKAGAAHPHVAEKAEDETPAAAPTGAATSPKWYTIYPTYPCGRGYWTALFLANRPEQRALARNANGALLDKAGEAAEIAQVIAFRDQVLHDLLLELAVVRRQPGAGLHQQALDSIVARIAELQDGDQVQLDDVHFMATLSGNRVRIVLHADVRRIFPPSQHDVIYGLPGPLEATLLFRFGSDPAGRQYGHFDCIAQANEDATEVFHLPAPDQVASAPDTEASRCLAQLYFAVSTKQELKQERPSCKQEPARPARAASVFAPDEVLHVIGSDSECEAGPQETKTESPAATIPGISKQEDSGGAALSGNHAATSDGFSCAALVQVSDSEEDLPSSGSAGEPPVRDPWLGFILDGSKEWELRSSNCDKNQGRIALGYAGVVKGFATFAEVLCVGVRVGTAYTGLPENPEHYWLAPHNLHRHRCTAKDVEKMKWTGRYLYAWVLRAVAKAPPGLTYRKTAAVTWGHMQPAKAMQAAHAAPAPEVPRTEDMALVLSKPDAEILARGQATAVAVKVPVEDNSVVHIYSATMMRLEGVLTFGRVQCCASAEEAVSYVRSHGLKCPNIPRASGAVHICEVVTAKASRVPAAFPLVGQPGRLVLFDPSACFSLRPKLSADEMLLRGHSPLCSLHATCNYFVDRMATADIARLQANLVLLDGLCLRTASTCSGLDSCIPVLKHTLAALNERFGTTITCKHVLSCDIDEARQDFIRKAHPDDVSVLMSDCSQFSSGKVRCILQDKDISIPEADILIAGPSCQPRAPRRGRIRWLP